MSVYKCSVVTRVYVQADAVMVDSSGKRHMVHSGLLKLHFPVFRGIKLRKNQVVIMDCVSPSEAELIIELAYGGGR